MLKTISNSKLLNISNKKINDKTIINIPPKPDMEINITSSTTFHTAWGNGHLFIYLQKNRVESAPAIYSIRMNTALEQKAGDSYVIFKQNNVKGQGQLEHKGRNINWTYKTQRTHVCAFLSEVDSPRPGFEHTSIQ